MKRYPGVSPFTSEQQNIFYGRSNDIDKLKKLISLRKQVLLYSKSGVGKTSLLNAGVLPALENKFIIVKVRFFAYEKHNFQSPITSILDALNEATKSIISQQHTILNTINKDQNNETNLWYHFKKIQLSNKIETKFLLVFDQFEELFTYPDNLIDEFKFQLFELIREDFPDEITEYISKNSKIVEHKEFDILNESLNIKNIYSIRADKLSLLNKITDKIADIQKTFYELTPLSTKQAEHAIIKPANKVDDFDSLPFNYNAQAVSKIIDTLTNQGSQNIEATQLQLICIEIENNVEEKQKQTLKNSVIEIKENELPQFKDVFLRFYEDSISKVQTQQQAKVKALIEDQLIRNNQRILLDEIICKENVHHSTLKTLIGTHLLRAERNTSGRLSYELCHDVLIKPILQLRTKRIEKVKQIKKEDQINKEKQKLKQKIIRWAMIISFVFVALLIILSYFLFNEIQSTTKLNVELKTSQNELKLKRQELEKKNIRLNILNQSLTKNIKKKDSLFVLNKRMWKTLTKKQKLTFNQEIKNRTEIFCEHLISEKHTWFDTKKKRTIWWECLETQWKIAFFKTQYHPSDKQIEQLFKKSKIEIRYKVTNLSGLHNLTNLVEVKCTSKKLTTLKGINKNHESMKTLIIQNGLKLDGETKQNVRKLGIEVKPLN